MVVDVVVQRERSGEQAKHFLNDFPASIYHPVFVMALMVVSLPRSPTQPSRFGPDDFFIFRAQLMAFNSSTSPSIRLQLTFLRVQRGTVKPSDSV